VILRRARTVALTVLVGGSVALVAGCSSSASAAGVTHCSSVSRCIADAEKKAQTGPLLFPDLPRDTPQDAYYWAPAPIAPAGSVQIGYTDSASRRPFYWKIHPDSLRSASASVCAGDGSNMTNMITTSGRPMCFMTKTGQQFFYSVGTTLYVLQAPSSSWPATSGLGSPTWALAILGSLTSSNEAS
jgi:hypothetical protein